MASAAVEPTHCFDDLFELRLLQLGIYRERDDFLRRALALRKRAPLVSEVLEARLQM
jgi:hypothetical protein